MKRFRSYFKEQTTLPMRTTFGLLHCISSVLLLSPSLCTLPSGDGMRDARRMAARDR